MTNNSGARKALIAMSALALALTATACASGGDVVTSCKNQKLTVGASSATSLQYASEYIADKKGYFKDEGLTVKRISLGGGSEALQALIGGSIDVAATSFGAVLTAKEKGAPLVAFASTVTRNAADVGIRTDIAPPAGSDLTTSIRSLKGKKISVTSAGSSTDQTIRFLIKKAGLNPDKDVTIIATGGAAEAVAAFVKGSVDAFIIGAPASQVAAERGKGTIMLELASGIAPNLDDQLYGAVATTKRTLQRKEMPLRCYAKAMDKSVKLITDHPDEAGALLRADFPDLTDAQFDAAWKPIVKATPHTAAIQKPQAEKTAAFLAFVLGRDKIDPTGAYDTRFSNDLS